MRGKASKASTGMRQDTYMCGARRVWQTLRLRSGRWCRRVCLEQLTLNLHARREYAHGVVHRVLGGALSKKAERVRGRGLA